MEYLAIRVAGLWRNHGFRARLFDCIKKESDVMGEGEQRIPNINNILVGETRNHDTVPPFHWMVSMH